MTTMEPMTKEALLRWQAGYEEVNAIVLAERRAATLEERLRDLDRIMAGAEQLFQPYRRTPQQEADIEAVRER